MATAEELLAVGESAENKVLIIDSDLRTISVPSDFGVFGVESDDDVLRVHFRGPRFYNGIDLSTFTLRVNVKNAEGNTDAYEVDDLEAEDNSITFSWLISRFVAHCAGTIKFALCFREIDEEGIVTREFNTTTAIGTILEGLEAEKEIEFEYPDFIERLRAMLERLESNYQPGESTAVSPTATVTQTASGAKITITDKNGTTSATVMNGRNGQDGFSPTISVTTITGGHRLIITDVDSTKVVDILDGLGGTGDTGNSGAIGKDGRGIASVRRTSGDGSPGTTDTYTITYTDNTTSTFTVYNGKDYTLTSDDKSEIVNSVLAALPTWTGGSY